MKAFVVDRYKSKSAVRLGETPEPEVRDDDVLVQVHAASLNQLDSKIRDGEFKLILPYRLPLILGNDDEHRECRSGQESRRGCRHRLQERRFREGPERLRRRPEQSGQGHARKVPQGAEARWKAHFHLRSTGCSVREAERVELVLATR